MRRFNCIGTAVPGLAAPHAADAGSAAPGSPAEAAELSQKDDGRVLGSCAAIKVQSETGETDSLLMADGGQAQAEDVSSHRLDPVKLEALRRVRAEFPGTRAGTQRQRLQAAFERHRTLSTMEIRLGLDVLHPAARVLEMRKAGCEIMTAWATVEHDDGDEHRVARYVWVHGAGGGHVAKP